MLFWLYLYMFTFESQRAPSVIKSQTMQASSSIYNTFTCNLPIMFHYCKTYFDSRTVLLNVWGREHVERLGERFIRHSTLYALLLQQSFDTQSGRFMRLPQFQTKHASTALHSIEKTSRFTNLNDKTARLF